MPKIAISYRRSDSSAIAGRIYDYLVSRYGQGSVFMDIDSIPYGADFRKHIQLTLSQTQVLIAVIGPDWLGVQESHARILDKSDLVRVEVETALQMQLMVIPVLVDGCKIPSATQLPKSLRGVTHLNAAAVSGGVDFHVHMSRLIHSIDRVLMGPSEGARLAENVAADNTVAGKPEAGGNLSPRMPLRTYWVYYIGVPALLMFVAHHLIINSWNLDTVFLRASSFLIPLVTGVGLFWQRTLNVRVACVLSIAIGVISVSFMTISEALNSGQPIMPKTTFEWKENIEYAVAIAVSFFVGSMVSQRVRLIRWKR